MARMGEDGPEGIVQIRDLTFRPMIDSRHMSQAIASMAEDIAGRHTASDPLIVCALNGAAFYALSGATAPFSPAA